MRFLGAALLFAAPLFAQGDCTFVVAPLTVTAAATGYSGTVSVTQSAGGNCGSFSAVSQVNWLHITSDPGVAPVSFIVDANQGANPRIGVMRIALQNVTVTQAAANCVFGISPKSQSFPVGGGSSVFAVQANCAWATSASAGWITFPGGTPSGSADRSSNFAIAANRCVAARNGSITVVTGLAAPPVLSIAQDGSPDNLTLSVYSASAGPEASDNRITVSTGDGCGWSASSDVSWMKITSGSTGSGNGGIVYHLLQNTSVARTGSIHVGGQVYTVTQQAAAAPSVVLSGVTNAANYAQGAVSPGEIVSLFGANIGPVSPAQLQVSQGTVTNSLAGTQVFFDDVAAPITFSFAGQVNAVVPYGVAGKSVTTVRVQYQGVASNTMTLPVQAAMPGIFSVDSSGGGPGAILNQDNTLNSAANPAARGSIVQIFLTGGGITTPQASDGVLTGIPPPLLPQTPLVNIGGVGARVEYAGAAPGAVAGLTQINAEIPAAVSSGLALPVSIKIGNFASTGAATLAVK